MIVRRGAGFASRLRVLFFVKGFALGKKCRMIQIMNTQKLSPIERLILMEIERLGPTSKSTYATLAAYVGVTPRTIGNTIAALKSRGLIEVSKSRRNPWRVITEKGRALL